jgi:hypothetical protein
MTSQLAVAQRPELERLLFFNDNQHRVRGGIVASIDTYGVPEICERDGALAIRVGVLEGVQSVFAVSAVGRPLGVGVYARLPHNRIVVLHLGVEPSPPFAPNAGAWLLLRLLHEIRSASRATRGVDRVELVYRSRRPLRLQG